MNLGTLKVFSGLFHCLFLDMLIEVKIVALDDACILYYCSYYCSCPLWIHLATLLKESNKVDVNGVHLNHDHFGLHVFLMLQIRENSSCTQHP